MASITSTSTFAEIKAEYLDTASYAEDNSPTKAKAFITACRALVITLPKSSGHGSSTTTFNPDLIQKEMNEAKSWLSVNDTSSSTKPRRTRFISLEGFRC